MEITPPNPLIPPIRTDGSNAFADHTVKVRLTDILNETLRVNPNLFPAARAAVMALRDEIAAGGLIQMLPARDLAQPEYHGWAAACAARPGATWHGVDWFFCETFMYRRLMQAVAYFETEDDPFLPIKRAEYEGAVHLTVLDNALLVGQVSGNVQKLNGALAGAVFGNRVDLSYAESRAHGLSASDSDLLVDDRPMVIDHLLEKPAGDVHVVADNAGSELSADLCLIDVLLRENIATRVVLHVKFHPTFVSDVIRADVLRFMMTCEAGRYGLSVRRMGARLRDALRSGRLALADDPFWNSPYFAWEMPDELAESLQAAALVIVKGDANYRRFMGDALWPHETPFADVVGGLGMNLLMLRTLKSDPLVGLAAGVAENLESQDPRWRWSGKRAVIQAHLHR